MISNVAKTLIIAVAGAAFLLRGYAAFKGRGSSGSQAAVIPLWFVWIPSFFLLLAGVTYNKFYFMFVSAHIGEWFIYVPRVACGIIGFVIGSYACIRLRLLPENLLPRWREWTIVAGMLALVDYTLLTWIGWHLFPDRLESFDRVADLTFRTCLLIATVKIGLPALQWCRSREPGIILRMRLNYLWWLNFIFALWMLVDILALGHEMSLFTTPLALAFWICFILGLFTPDSVYQYRLTYLYHLETFFLIRFLEVLACFEADKYVEKINSTFAWTPRYVDWHEVIKYPEHAAYKSIIALLDTSKTLHAQPAETLAGSLGRRINPVRGEHSDYLGVMNHLREVGFEYLIKRQALGTLLNGTLQLRNTAQVGAELLV